MIERDFDKYLDKIELIGKFFNAKNKICNVMLNKSVNSVLINLMYS